MKPLHRYLLVAGLAGTLGIGAIAQSQIPAEAPAQPAQQVEQQRDRMQKKSERRLGQLKQKMQITTAQEGAWNAWAATVKPGPKAQRPNREEFAALSTPERIDRLRAARAQRDAEMDRRFDATKTFYATLTPEQKQVFDAESLRVARHHQGKQGMFRRG
jgi:periplasmic protein CpxP/Spy